ncbi:hypothetical protein AQF52_2605 [Streptomyces venezuelae]|uniref:Uncharacterized protein n=1 Tax=Streptomyces parvus TaxID=66428 RepID=A0A5D4JK57_9ACTN|nr:hypothetical protein AQF52_2605 [Streptomyces venezuelae]TYR65662.1 hypothetical protein FY004_04815 [Streptomyces parvus]CUM41447.1 hypothetical protein BN2537_11859 [Streptomyces venezuelae]
MMRDPNMVFSTDPRHGLVARSGWEQEEARTVLRDLGWEWTEELHALVPPDDVPEVDAGLQAVEELHLHGHRTGYAAGPYGTMRLTLDRAEQVFTKVAAREPGEVTPDPGAQNDQPGRADTRRPTYGGVSPSEGPVEPDGPESPAI